MRPSPIFFFLFITVLYLGVDIYAYQAFLKVFGSNKWLKFIYWGISAILLGSLLFALIKVLLGHHLSNLFLTRFFTFFLILFVPKLLLFGFMFIEDITRGVRWVIGKFDNSAPVDAASKGTHISRSKFLSQSALVIAGLPFVHLLYGALKGKYDFTVHRVKVPIPNLPSAFEGFTITQLSDIHTGSFDNMKAVERGIDLANSQNSDIIFFTGDLVNNRTEELDGYKGIFAKLTAPLGVYSILGNHDYGDYEQNWSGDEEKAQNFQNLLKTHASMGWNLLKNQHQIIEKDGANLALVGVENWGRDFVKHGDLDLAIATNKVKVQTESALEQGTVAVKDADLRILLSHDPSHWSGQVQAHPLQFDLTLSGHTHGMQFGIEIPGLNIKWSPIKWKYPQWAGLYTDEKKQHLYVNRGFGHLGYLGRAGIFPEVTVLELTKG